MTCSQSGGELHGHSCFLRECGFLFGEVIISEVTKQEAIHYFDFTCTTRWCSHRILSTQALLL